MASSFTSKLAFGTGGRFGRLSFKKACELVSHAYGQGITTFDTGANYCRGHSQPLLFDCLMHLGVNRGSYAICTKVSAETLRCSDHEEILQIIFSGYQNQIGYLDVLMLWGASIGDLADPCVLDQLVALRSSGLAKRIGVNTHHSKVMEYIASSDRLLCIDDLMVDFNLLQRSRLDFMQSFLAARPGRRIWAGTALCQGFLLQSLLAMYVRTRSASYLLRALLNPPTRTYWKKAARMRAHLRNFFKADFARVPLSYVCNCDAVSHVPIGMLSRESVNENILITRSPVPARQIESFLLSTPDHLQLADVF